MSQLNLSIPPKHREKLEKLSQVKGISMSELVRRWIDKEYEPLEQIINK